MLGGRRPGFLGLIAGILLLQGVASLSVYVRGFPYYGSGLVPNAPWWEVPIAILHLPGIEVLTLFGFCCGLHGGDILTHVIHGGHIPMRGFGTTVLATVNWACWSLIAAAAYLVLTWRGRRKLPSPPAPPA
ncbi:MAG TPA: hypothetical protein VMG41_01980 [Gemmatimonadales bacterium]|nr:hypothetical protein [Gemmatimonadales bacterium]